MCAASFGFQLYNSDLKLKYKLFWNRHFFFFAMIKRVAVGITTQLEF